MGPSAYIHGAVGVYLVAEVDEEVGLQLAHLPVDAIAAEVRVDAIALPAFVAGKGEADAPWLEIGHL
jgi:hypothetical protein